MFEQSFSFVIYSDTVDVYCTDDQPVLLPAVIEAKIQQILQPLTVPLPRPVQAPLNVKPKLNFSTHPSAKQATSMPPLDQSALLASQRGYGSESNLLDALSSATDGTGDSGNWSRSGLRAAGSVPDLLSPQAGQLSEEPPPLPPERSGPPAVKSDAVDGMQQGFYDTPGAGDDFYNTPPVKYFSQSDAAEFYNVPPVTYLAERDDDVGNACYDVPPVDETDQHLAKKAGKKQAKAKVCEVSEGGDVYNVPPTHNDDHLISTGSASVEFYENVPSSGGKKARGTERTGSLDNQKSAVQSASFCIAEQMYDSPSSEHWGGKLQSQNETFSAIITDETYDTPPRNEISKKVPPQKLSDKRSVNFQPLANISDQTYDTPSLSESAVKTHPIKPDRGKPKSSLEPSETERHAEPLSGQETYDIPSILQQHSAAGKPAVSIQTRQQSAIHTDETYNMPHPKSAMNRSSNRTSAPGAVDVTGLAEEGTYNVPSSCVPPVPAKRNPAPPPKPPRPRVSLPGQSSSVSPAQESLKAMQKILDSELAEKDTVAELPVAGRKGMFIYSEFKKIIII